MTKEDQFAVQRYDEVEVRVAAMSRSATFVGMPSAWKRWLRCETRPSEGEDTLDELNSGRSGSLRRLDRSVATLAEILEVSAEPATRAGLAKLEQRELDHLVDCYLLQGFGYQIEGGA